MAFLLNEDRAMKAKVSGLTVTDVNAPGGRPVVARFRLPEDEVANQTFPLIAVTRMHMEHAPDREHRGRVGLLYTPESIPDWNPLAEDAETTPYVVDYPVPMDVVYQITVRARKNEHITSLVAALAAQDRLPYRFGYLEVPEDGTVRSLFVDGGPEYSTQREGDKRLFQADYNIRIPTELLPATIEAATAVSEVVLSELELLVPTSQ